MFDAQLRVVDCNDLYRRLFSPSGAHSKPGQACGPGHLQRHTDGTGLNRRFHHVSPCDFRPTRAREPADEGLDGNGNDRNPSSATDDGGLVATYDDITEREHSEIGLAQQTSASYSALNHMRMVLGMFDGERNLMCVIAFAEMYLRLPASLDRQRHAVDRINRHRTNTRQAPRDAMPYHRHMRQVSGRRQRELPYRTEGTAGTIQVDYEPMFGGGWS